MVRKIYTVRWLAGGLWFNKQMDGRMAGRITAKQIALKPFLRQNQLDAFAKIAKND
jgi:hypothetical protein